MITNSLNDKNICFSFGFVTFESAEEANKVREQVNNILLSTIRNCLLGKQARFIIYAQRTN